ncbi:MAG: hypothetical protein RLZZ244_1293 [Verrucomicrobiota bacterium]
MIALRLRALPGPECPPIRCPTSPRQRGSAIRANERLPVVEILVASGERQPRQPSAPINDNPDTALAPS